MTSARGQKSLSEKERIIEQFRRAFYGEAWHGPSVMSLLQEVNATQASAHPIQGAHSIWELVLHIAAWENACTRRINGDRAQLTDEEDWTPVNDSSEPAWEQAKQHLVATHDELLTTIAGIDEAQLDAPIIDDPEIPFSTLYVTLHGVVQHDLYHAGQIALMKKAIAGVAA